MAQSHPCLDLFTCVSLLQPPHLPLSTVNQNHPPQGKYISDPTSSPVVVTLWLMRSRQRVEGAVS